jgi:hypothetical protein
VKVGHDIDHDTATNAVESLAKISAVSDDRRCLASATEIRGRYLILLIVIVLQAVVSRAIVTRDVGNIRKDMIRMSKML